MPEKLDFKNAASTASLIVIENRNIFLIKRKHEPFKGKWALPGGFHNCDQETLEQTAIRELKEETNIEITESNLELVCVNSGPKRDPRGHVIDHVFWVDEFTGTPEAADDAEVLQTFDIENLPELAFDHEKVINDFIKWKYVY